MWRYVMGAVDRRPWPRRSGRFGVQGPVSKSAILGRPGRSRPVGYLGEKLALENIGPPIYTASYPYSHFIIVPIQAQAQRHLALI